MARDHQGVVLITGASCGIGACCAAYLAERGYRVYGASRSAQATHPAVLPLAMDVTGETSVLHAVDTILGREGRLDIVVNSAGSSLGGAIEDTSVQEACDQFDVNFFGVLRVCRAALPILRRQGAGYIVNIGSIAGLLAVPYQGLYSASKFALEGLTEALRLEVRALGVRVVLIEPGDHRTSFTDRRRMALASAPGSVYHRASERAIARMASDEQNGQSPGSIARLLHRIVNTDQPRLRYTAGPGSQRAAVWLKRLAPYSLVEKIMLAYYAR